MAEKSRLAYLLGEVRRQMNGAVASSMRFYGEDYGLNYGVSIPTIRTIARAEECEHRLARTLYKQEVRELRLIAGYIADIEQVQREEEREFWSRGVINSEVAEELAFSLLHKIDWVEKLLYEDNELLQYCALLALAKRCENENVQFCENCLTKHETRIVEAIELNPKLLPKGLIAMLSTALKLGVSTSQISTFTKKIKGDAAAYVAEEMQWRLESI